MHDIYGIKPSGVFEVLQIRNFFFQTKGSLFICYEINFIYSLCWIVFLILFFVVCTTINSL